MAERDYSIITEKSATIEPIWAGVGHSSTKITFTANDEDVLQNIDWDLDEWLRWIISLDSTAKVLDAIRAIDPSETNAWVDDNYEDSNSANAGNTPTA